MKNFSLSFITLFLLGSLLLYSYNLKGLNSFIIEGNIAVSSEWKSVLYLSKIPNYESIMSGYDGLVVDSAVIDKNGYFKP